MDKLAKLEQENSYLKDQLKKVDLLKELISQLPENLLPIDKSNTDIHTQFEVIVKEYVDSKGHIKERVKELNCLYQVAQIVSDEDQIPTLLQRVLQLIPPAWLYPKYTEAQIAYKDHVECTDGFSDTPWQISSPIVVDGKEQGSFTVEYSKEMPELFFGPFLKEEVSLLETLARIMGKAIERIIHFQEMEASNQQLRASEQEIKAMNQQLQASEQQLRASNEFLKQSEKQFKSVFDGIHDLIYVSDPNTYELIHLNDKAQRLWGKEIEGKKCYELLQNKDKPCDFCTNAIIFDEKPGKTHIWEYYNEASKRWYKCTDKVIQWHDGREVRFEIATDITDLKEKELRLRSMNQQLIASEQQMKATNQQLAANEQQLRAANQQLIASENHLKKINSNLLESEEKFKSLAQSSPLAILMYQNDFWVYANPAAQNLVEYSMEELCKMRYYEVVHPDHVALVKSSGKKRQTKKGYNSSYEFKVISKSGKEKWVLLSGSTTTYRGKPAGIISIMDLTDRKQFEMKLATSEQKYRSLIENTSEGFWLIDKTKKTLEVNPALSSMLGYKENEILEKSPLDFFDKPHRDIARFQMSKMGDTEHRSFEVEITRKNGEKLPVLIDSTTMYSDEGELLGSFSYVKDISFLKKFERQLKEAKEKAELSDQLKTAFLANMSHEIRTPMNGILGFTELLKYPDLEEMDKLYYIDIIQKSGARMLSTLNDIVDIAKIESGQMDLNYSEIDLKALVEELVDFFKTEAEGKGLQLILNYQGSEALSSYRTDRNKLYSILNNLIKNAIKFTISGKIEVSIMEETACLICSVKDTGIGIPKDRLKAIFNRFEQADISDKQAFQGSGLGLSITASYAQMLGGSVHVKSKPEVGSTFTVNLPLDKSKSDKNKNCGEKSSLLPP